MPSTNESTPKEPAIPLRRSPSLPELLLASLALLALPLVSARSRTSAAEEWEAILLESINSPYSETRHAGLKQVDANSVDGLKALWKVLESRDADRFDWYVREGADEALSEITSEEAREEVERLLAGSGNDLAKEAVVYSIIWKIRKQFVKDHGGNDDRKIEEVKYHLRKARGVEYFRMVLPTIRKLDSKKGRLKWITIAFEDKSPRVRIAAINGFIAYPDNSTIPLLLENLRKLEKTKEKNFKEWVFTRFALETLTGQYYRDNVEDWLRWWDIVKKDFSIQKRVKDEKDTEEKTASATAVVQTGGVQVNLNMKIAGEGYPLLVLPQRGYEPDYFRPYFHGIEEFMRVHYVQMPQIDDFKGLARTAQGSFVMYPTEILADALAELMKKSGPEHFAIMGHGPASSTLAMIMARKFPDQASHLILINPSSAGAEYRNARDNVERLGRSRKSRELEYGAKNVLVGQDGKPTYEPADAAEERGLDRALGNVRYADPTSPEVGTRSYLYGLPGGTEVMNDSDWSIGKIFDRTPPRLPVMIIMGELNPWTPAGDMMRVASFFKGAYVAKFPRDSENPFMLEPDRFTKHLRTFASRTGIESAKGKKKGPSRSSERTSPE